MAESNRCMQLWLSQSAALILVVLFAALGIWQFNRGNFKSELQEATTTSEQSVFEHAVLPFKDAIEWRHKRVKFFGRFLSDQQFLLDNQVRDKQSGYNVLTPFLVEQSNTWILVDRGWISPGLSRAQLPSIEVDQQALMISGQVYVPYDPAFSLGGIAEGEDHGWPRRIQYVDYAELSQRLELELQPFTLRLAAQEPFGYRRDWQQTLMPARKHYGYALQWFALAAAVVVLWLIYVVRPTIINK